ncbi:MAG TPA: tetraacyldisaccharide 4'-kinase [Planctomycetaceae bacterium]|nr:tetraacyldisaccharide 4'-kinase [Planctomycetaceae bacterium]
MDEQFAIDVISGRHRGVIPAALRTVCHVASWGYAAGMTLRNAAYDSGWWRSHGVDIPVISVGNITTGGTGKTPIVAWITHQLQARGRRPGILSRGYRSLDKTSFLPCTTGSASALTTSQGDKTLAKPVAHNAANDEAMVLAQLCPGVPQVAMRDRVAGAAIAIQQHGCDALVLDDAFQHRRLARDLDLVLIDATQPWGFGHLLPRGLLREPLSALKRADAVIITRADQVDAATITDLRHTVARVRGVDEHIAVRFAPQRLINTLGEKKSPTHLVSRKTIAFCGIGNPDGFRHTLRDLGLNAELRAFPDHHHYTAADLDRLAEWRQQHDAAALITTMKDLVKIPETHSLAEHIWAVDIAPEFLAGEEHMLRRLDGILPQRAIRQAA